MDIKDAKITVIGGGTGTFSVLSGLKKYTSNLTAIVTMADSGGSAEKERDEWGLLPSSDIRKSLIALADISTENNILLRKLFSYRYSEGKGIAGMTFGNLFLVALTKLMKSQVLAIEKAGELLSVKGKVLPVTLEKIDLAAILENGRVIKGEHAIDEPKHDGSIRIKKLYTVPQAVITENARDAITEADFIIIGPGGFYTTVVANLVIKGVRQALDKSRAKKLFIMNLMTEYGQTYGFKASDFIFKLADYMNIKSLDYLLINSKEIPSTLIKKYMKDKAQVIINDLNNTKKYPFKIISEDILSNSGVRKQKGDTLKRSYARHDPHKIALICKKIVKSV